RYVVGAVARGRRAAARRRRLALPRVAPRALVALLAAGLVALPAALAAQQRHRPRQAAKPRPPAPVTGSRVPTPKSILGFEPGEDRKLADWPALLHYYQALAPTSDRVRYRELGKTTLGVPLVALVVDSLHNVWHPEIVHDIHQQDTDGSRLFLPPYLDPVEPNVDPLLVDGVNALGADMAWQLAGEGKTGISINAIYDAWTPARAY